MEKTGIKSAVEKALNIRLSFKIINVLLIALLVMLLLPMAIIAKYDVPSSDDFGHCVWTAPVFEETGSVLQVIATAFKWVGYCFTHISGTFTVQVLDALAPNVFGVAFYRITFFIMLASLMIALLFFYKTVFTDSFKVEKVYISILSTVTMIIFTQCLPSSAEGFYWYVGAVTYTFYFALFLIMNALLVRVYQEKSIRMGIVGAAVLTFVLGGGNHITALMTGVVLVGAVAFSLMNKKKIRAFIAPFLTWAASFAINIIAPGNAVRTQATGGGAGLIKSFFLAFKAIIESVNDWSSLPFLALVMLLIPVLWVSVTETSFQFRYPAVISALSFCFLAAMYYPPIFGMNSTGQGRLKNIVFFSYTILLIFNLFYWIGWLKPRVIESNFAKCKNGLSVVYIAILVMCFGFGALATVLTPITSYSATVSLINGEAKEYYQTETERLEIIENSKEADIVLPAFRYKPYTIFFHDITENAEDGQNMAMAEYYQKNTIVIEEES